MSKVLFIFILIFSSVCMAQDQTFASFPNNQYSELSIKRTIPLQGIINIPLSCFVIKDSILMINEFRQNSNDFLISFWSLKNGKRLDAAIRVGKGPEEHLPPLELHVWGDNIELWDPQRGQYRYLYIDNNLNLNEISGEEKFEGLPLHLLKINNVFVGSGRGETKYHLSIYNNTDRKVISRLKYPEFEPLDRLDPALYHHLMDGNYIKHPSKPLFAYSAYATPIFTIYNVENPSRIETVFSYKLREDVKIIDSYNKGGMRFLQTAKDHPQGGRSPVSTDQYLYYLYLGVSPGNPNSDQILKLDWDGGFDSGYKLDKDVVTFTINKDKIIAIDEFWESILIYDLE